jgi:uncharacterized protein (TIGR02453 family)
MAVVWPPEAFEFLTQLSENNTREWFKANRAGYDEYLRRPAEELAESLSDLGEPRFFRPYRDARFHRGDPIREDIAVAIMPGAVAGYYFQLSLGGLMLGAGLHEPRTDQLERFREAIDDDHQARGFETAIGSAGRLGFKTSEPELKRVPRGYASDHRRGEWLRMKSITVFKRHAPDEWLLAPEADATVRVELDATTPLVAWLSETVGP